MSDISKLDHHELTDTELDVVTGGMLYLGATTRASTAPRRPSSTMRIFSSAE
jgi:hypothetical protein